MRVSTICRILGGVALAVACSVPAVAQQKLTYYHSDCVKIKPGRGADFASQLDGNVMKVEQAEMDSGRSVGFAALRVVVPSGKEARCDYIIDTFYRGLPPAPMSDEELAATIKKAGLDLTVEAFWKPIEEDSVLINASVGEVPVVVGVRKKGDYEVLNYMNMPDMNACLNTEKKLWQPLAEARMKAGQQAGWAVWESIYPRGSQVSARAGTADLYSSWDQVFQEGLMQTWQQVHPDVKIGDAMAQFNNQCEIKISEVYKVVESIGAPMQ